MDEEIPERAFSRGGYYPTEDITLWMNVEAHVLKTKSDQHFLTGLVSAILSIIALGLSIHYHKYLAEHLATAFTILLFLFVFYTIYAFYKSYIYFVQAEQHVKNSDMPETGVGRLTMCFSQKMSICARDVEEGIPEIPTAGEMERGRPGPSNEPPAPRRAQRGRSRDRLPEQGPSIVTPSPRRPPQQGRSIEVIPRQCPTSVSPSPRRGRRQQHGGSLDLIPEQGPSTRGQQRPFATDAHSLRISLQHRSGASQSNVSHLPVPEHRAGDPNISPQYRGRGRNTTSTSSLPQFPEGGYPGQPRYPVVERAIWIPPRGLSDPEQQQGEETEGRSTEEL